MSVLATPRVQKIVPSASPFTAVRIGCHLTAGNSLDIVTSATISRHRETIRLLGVIVAHKAGLVNREFFVFFTPDYGHKP
ncbi:hypothetical protein FACS1894208_04540 [Clostridia bacterium]|nr:hypothetical protein FACS1894208_04540 [Clostridia bacterium]